MGQVSMILGLSLLFIGARTALAVPNGRYVHPELIIQPEELKHLIDQKAPDIRIIDVRQSLKYFAGHIPGAVQVWRSDIEDKTHALPGMMAPQAQIEELMGNVGINDQDTLIIYSDGPDNGRLWWILAYYGFPLKQMKLLDGGIDGWKGKAYPTEMIPARLGKARFKLPEKRRKIPPLLCTLPEVKSALDDPKKVVLDVRSKKEYLGEEVKEGAAKGGRIPGVVWIEWNQVLVEEGAYQGCWKSSKEIKRIFSTKGVTTEKEIYLY